MEMWMLTGLLPLVAGSVYVGALLGNPSGRWARWVTRHRRHRDRFSRWNAGLDAYGIRVTGVEWVSPAMVRLQIGTKDVTRCIRRFQVAVQALADAWEELPPKVRESLTITMEGKAPEDSSG